MNTFCYARTRQSAPVLPISFQVSRSFTLPELPSPILPNAAPGTASCAQLALSAAVPREQAMVEHLAMVRSIARRIHARLPQHVDLEDLMSAGVIGLMDAFGKYDETKQVQFVSYAQFRVRGAILDSLRTLDWGPRELRRQGRAIQQAQQNLTARLNRAPTEAEIACELGLELGEYQRVLGEIRSLEVDSLNVEHGEENTEKDAARVPARAEEGPLFLCLHAESRAQLAAAIETLSERGRLLITLRYYEELTMREIGEVLDLGVSRVSQLHTAAVAQLRAALTATKTAAKQESRRRKRRACA